MTNTIVTSYQQKKALNLKKYGAIAAIAFAPYILFWVWMIVLGVILLCRYREVTSNCQFDLRVRG